MAKTKRKWWVRLLRGVGFTLAGIIGLFGLALGGYAGISHIVCGQYYKESSKAFKMPGLSDGVIHQGLDYDERSSSFFMCGYMLDDSASRLYVVNKASGDAKMLKFAKADGSAFSGHAGGVAVHGDYIYLAGSSSGCVYVYSYAEAISASNGDSIRSLGEYLVKTDNDKIRVSFTGISENRLILGEYYKSEKSYSTPKNHHVQTADGEAGGIAIGIPFSDHADAIFGLAPQADIAYSLPNLTQGVTSHNGRFYASTSAGLSYSKIYNYDLSQAKNVGNTSIIDLILPTYALDTSCLIAVKTTLPMAEELVVVDDEMYISTESASKRFLFGNLLGARYMWKTDISFFEN